MKSLGLKYIPLLLSVLPGLCGCDDSFRPQVPGTEAGLPATLSLEVKLPAMDEATSRADMAEGMDRKVSSLWIAVYNSSTGERTGFTELLDLDENLDHTFRDVTVSALSGPSYIVGVANYEGRTAFTPDGGATPMSDALAAADTWDSYRAIAMAYSPDGTPNIEAPINALIMSGHYTATTHSDGSRPELTPVTVRPGMSTLPGAIHLRRLTSQIKFNISYNPDNISSFRVQSWHVENIPSGSWLDERADASDGPVNAPDAMTFGEKRYTRSQELSDLSFSGNTWSFDFWQLENKRTGLPLPAGLTTAEAYARRELEYKDAQGRNTGKYVSLIPSADSDDFNNMAGYVVFDVSMVMKVDADGKPLGSGISTRLVETRYVVHLGYCEGADNLTKARDFNCRRNTKYTYNVRINNVSDILVEVDDGMERRPGAEGIVSDISGEFYNVDAHYACMNIRLTADDLRAFQYYIMAYGPAGESVVINSMQPSTVPGEDDADFKYLGWVEFRKTSNASTLAAYKPRKGAGSDGATFLLSELAGKSAGYYTMFINEYVYEDKAHAGGNEFGSTAWRGYVNRPDRRVWLNVTGTVSADGESIHYKSKYAVSQASIQTYYNDLPGSALGVEHTNESLGLNLRNEFNPHLNSSGTELNKNTTRGRNSVSGRYNLAQHIMGNAVNNSGLSWTDDSKQWSDFLTLTAAQSVNAINNQGISRAARTEPLPAIRARSNGSEYNISGMTSYDPDRSSSPKYIEAIRACLNRNRDNDGDGRISADEIRWFVPTSAQYVRIILGRRSLVHPLLDYANISRLPNNTARSNGQNSSMLFYSANGKMMWLMEGTSESEWRQWPASCAAPWEVRCVRLLGIDQTKISATNNAQPAFEVRPGTNIIDLKYYDPKSVREERFLSDDGMPPHVITDQRYNRCYKSFEVFDSVIPLNDSRLGLTGKTIEWADYITRNNPCKVLDYTGKEGWRVPNQKELTIIGITGFYNRNTRGSTFQVSSSFAHFDYSGYAPGKNPDDPAAGGTVTGAYRFPMKITSGSGNGTQSEEMNNIYINNSYYGIRCVRDVE